MSDPIGDDDEHVDRRTFLAGVGTLGAGGVAGCLGDDGGSSTPSGTSVDTRSRTAPSETTGSRGTTDSRTATDSPTATDPRPTPTPTPPDGTVFDPVPADLTYEYYEGSFASMPEFGELSPTSDGEADRLTADLADGAGALRFTGTLPGGEQLEPGTYTFFAGEKLLADGRLGLHLDGIELSFSEGTRSLFLGPGENELRVDYYQPEAGGQIILGWMGLYGELLPPLADTDPERRGKQRYEYELQPDGRCQGKMMQMPNSGSETSQRSLAVALPTYTNYCFDMNTCRVDYAWRGAFLDYGPLSSYGGAAGDEPGQPLGLTYSVGSVAYPLRVGDPDTTPDTVEYRGFREEPYPAKLYYTVDGVDVTQTVEGVVGSLGVQYTVRFDGPPSDPVYFLTAEDGGFDRSASAGTWNGGTLEVPAGTEEFAVTVVDTQVRS